MALRCGIVLLLLKRVWGWTVVFGGVRWFVVAVGLIINWIPVRSFFDVGDGFEYCCDFDFKDFYGTYGERFV